MSAEKKRSALNYRVADSFRQKVEDLARETGHDVSDICRFGMLAYWPDIVSLVRASGGSLPDDPTQIEQLRDLIALCRSAQARKVDVKRAITDALEAALAA